MRLKKLIIIINGVGVMKNLELIEFKKTIHGDIICTIETKEGESFTCLNRFVLGAFISCIKFYCDFLERKNESNL